MRSNLAMARKRRPKLKRNRSLARAERPREHKGVKARVGILLGCGFAGAMFSLSMPPWGFWPLAFLAVTALDQLLARQKPTARFLRGWATSAVWLLGATFWMLDFSTLGYFAAGISHSFFYGVACALTPSGKLRWVAMPGWLVLVGYLRWRWPFGGVPLATLPQSQADAPLNSLAQTLGPLLITAVVAIIGIGLSALLERAWFSALGASGLVILAFLLTALAPDGASAAESPRTIRAAVVQGGGPQRTRAAFTNPEAVLARHLQATEGITEQVDLILWPENVVNIQNGLLSESDKLSVLTEVAVRHNAWFIPGVVEDEGPNEFLNFSLAISPEGNVVDRYDKVRRVPFGEYVPMRPFFERIAGDTLPSSDARAGTKAAVLNTELARMGVMISWEVFFEDRARDAARNGGELLLNPTNGSSYWLTIVQSQQVASSRLRAIETGRWVLQAAPTGFSAVINPSGDLLVRTDVSEQKVLLASPELRSGVTWAVRLGVWPMLALAAAAVALPVVQSLKERRPKKWK